MKSLYEYKWLAILVVANIILFAIGYIFLSQFLPFAGGLLASILGLFLFQLSDDKLLGNVDTYKEIIGNKNLAYAIYLLSISIIIAICFGSAFLVFVSNIR